MDVETKYKIVEKIIQSDDEHLLNEVQNLLGLSEHDFWTNLPNDVKNGINRAKEFDAGKGIPHVQIMEEIKTRFKNR